MYITPCKSNFVQMMDVADKTPTGCEFQPHVDVGPLYRLQWANSGLKPVITLLTLEIR